MKQTTADQINEACGLALCSTAMRRKSDGVMVVKASAKVRTISTYNSLLIASRGLLGEGSGAIVVWNGVINPL